MTRANQFDSTPSKPVIFISYSREDCEVAELIYGRLQAKGINVWMDKYDIRVGENWLKAIQRGLKLATHMLYIHSETAYESEVVWSEWSYFLKLEKTILPLIIDDTELPFIFAARQHITYKKDSIDETINKLIHALCQPHGSPDPDGGGAALPQQRTRIQKDHHVESIDPRQNGTFDRIDDEHALHLFVVPLSNSPQSEQQTSHLASKRTLTDARLAVFGSQEKAGTAMQAILRAAIIQMARTSNDKPDQSRTLEEAEQVVERAFREGVGLRPSDLRHLEYEIPHAPPPNGHTRASYEDAHSYSQLCIIPLIISNVIKHPASVRPPIRTVHAQGGHQDGDLGKGLIDTTQSSPSVVKIEINAPHGFLAIIAESHVLDNNHDTNDDPLEVLKHKNIVTDWGEELSLDGYEREYLRMVDEPICILDSAQIDVDIASPDRLAITVLGDHPSTMPVSPDEPLQLFVDALDYVPR